MSNGKKEKVEGQPVAGIALDELSGLLEMLRANDVTEFRWVRGDERLSLRRGSSAPERYAAPAPQFAPQYAPPSPVQPPQPKPEPFVTQTEARTVAPAVIESVPVPGPGPNVKLAEIKSPMVGTFYRRPTVDADPYVEVGDIVKKGSVLCIVEAMKLMNEIESDVSGKIVEICLEDGQMAEYGEVLFRIDPS